MLKSLATIKRPSKALAFLAAGVSAIALLSQPLPSVAQQEALELPTIYGAFNRREGGMPLQLDALENRIVNDALAWITAINRFDLNGFSQDIEYPLFMDNRYIQNADELDRAFRQWYVVNQLSNYTEQPWTIDAINFMTVGEWLTRFDNQERMFDYDQIALEVYQTLGLNPDGYLFFIAFRNPNDELNVRNQGLYIDLEGAKPVIRGFEHFY